MQNFNPCTTLYPVRVRIMLDRLNCIISTGQDRKEVLRFLPLNSDQSTGK